MKKWLSNLLIVASIKGSFLVEDDSCGSSYSYSYSPPEKKITLKCSVQVKEKKNEGVVQNSLQGLPAELKLIIISSLIDKTKTRKENLKELEKAKCLNSDFYRLIKSEKEALEANC